MTPPRVLIVDDDTAVQISLRAYLEDLGFTLHNTDNAARALELLAEHPIDVAIVDVRLREMTGEDLILRAHSIQPATRFLVYTGSLGYQLPDSLAQIGMSPADVLHKPVRALSVISDAIHRVAPPDRTTGVPPV